MTVQLELQGQEHKKMASGFHSAIAGTIYGHLFMYVMQQQSRPGYVLESSVTYNFQDGLPKRQPDVSFVSLEKMPAPPDEELSFAPDLAVEVVSKNDSISEIEAKVKQYRQAGTQLIWIVRPGLQIVEIYHPGDLKPTISGINDTLEGEQVLPGFKLSVKTLFEYK